MPATVPVTTSVLRDLILNVQRGQLDTVMKTLREFHASVLVDTATGEALPTCPLLRSYLQISPQSEPLVDLWGSALWMEDTTRQIIPVVMELLTYVFQYLHANSPSVAETVALHILKTKMELVSKQLSWSDKPHVEHATLALCTSMVSLHPHVAREFVRVFDFTAKFFDKLSVRRSKPFAPTASSTRQLNVRHAFIEFILALTRTDDQHIHRFALKGDGIAAGLFKPIDEDTFDDVETILSTLATSVLRSTDVRGKRAIYSSFSISQLVKLLDSSDARIANLAMQTFEDLFFVQDALYRVSQAATLAHLDPSSSTFSGADDTAVAPKSSEATAIKVVTKLLAAFDLTATMAHPTREALLFRFVTTYPALIVVVFQSFHAVMEPRPSYKWFAAASFVLKALQLPISALLTSPPATTGLANDMLVKLVLPLGMQKKELSKAVQHTDLLVVHSALNLILVVLQRAAALQRAAVDAAAAVEFQHAVRSLVPPPELIVSLCTKYRPTFDEAAAASPANKKLAVVYGKSLSLLQLYFAHLPQLMTETKFDLSKLIAPHLPLPLQGAVLGLLDVAETSRLAWIVVGDSTKFHMLLDYATATPASPATPLAYKVLRRVLSSLHTFGVVVPEADVPHEIDMWLQPLLASPSKDAATAAAAFVDVMVRGVAAHPFHFVNNHVSPMTQALVAYFHGHQLPFPLKHLDPSFVSAYGVQVMAKLVALYPHMWSILGCADNVDRDRDPHKLVCCFAETTQGHRLPPRSPRHRVTLSPKDALLHLETVQPVDDTVVVLTHDVLHAVWNKYKSFAIVWNYFRVHPSASVFASDGASTSPTLDAVRDRAKASPVIRQFLDDCPVDVVLASLFSPHVLLLGSCHAVNLEARHVTALLQSKALDTSTVQLAILQLVHGLVVYHQRTRLDLAPSAEYTNAVQLSTTALHFLLLWGIRQGSTPPAFYDMVWRYHADLPSMSSLHDGHDPVLLRWSVLPFALSAFVPHATMSTFLATHPHELHLPLSVVLTRHHLSPHQLHDALSAVLARPFVNTPLVVHLIAHSRTQTLPRPVLLKQVFACGQTLDGDDSAAVAVKGWLLHYVQHHPLVNQDAVTVPLFDACWKRLQSHPHDELNLHILEELLQRSRECRAAFTRVRDTPSRRIPTTLAGLVRLCAVYLSSLPLESDTVAWIESVVLPSFVLEILEHEQDDRPDGAAVTALVQACATLYRQGGARLTHVDWISDVVANKKHAVSASTLQLLLLAGQHADLTRQTSKCVSFGLAQLALHSTVFSDSVIDGVAGFTQRILSMYGVPKRVPLTTIQSFVRHLTSTRSWVTRHSLLDLVAAVAPRFPDADYSSLLRTLVDGFDTLHSNESYLKTLCALLQLSVHHAVDNDSVCTQEFLCAVLSSYGATTSPVDLLLKSIVDALVADGTHLTLHRVGYCFGKANHLSAGDLEQHWLLDEIDADTMKSSIEHFPHDRPFAGQYVVAPSSSNRAAVYDPAFFLPLVAHTLSTSSIPDRHLLQSGILGYAICGLSAEDDMIRSFAYGIVASAHESMSSTARTFEFNERRQVHLLLETLKNGIAHPHTRLPFLISVFVNDAISALLKPGHFMYPLVNAFLLSRSALDVNDVPMFYALFNSSSTMFRAERSWLLHLIKRGLKVDLDVDLLQRRHVFSIFLGFFDSPLADAHTQALVLEILTKAAATAAGNVALVHKMGLLGWLQAVMTKHEGKFTALVLALVETSIEVIRANGATSPDDICGQSYHLSERPSDRYGANTMSQLHQLCRTLAYQRQRCSNDRESDFARLPAVLTKVLHADRPLPPECA
ncbi:hypothetical protein DYB32_003618 [Aphanomyces invadans]|uniref:Nucleolar pre-ribosomal-associated protein 1 C-terminal domain-containing protein n=1 Tax=Aphanomyces invadans TaxID=157072 RepID=A0A3R7D2H3_9STRA|nr:hypothetical protein DYB32_003618 [Aphanomyces invadans]